MKKITSTFYDKIEYNPQSYNVKIGWYDDTKNQFIEVARFRNSYNKTSGANYGLLQIWSCLYNVSFGKSQGGRNTCGGYNKPIANLEGCLYQFKTALESELVNDRGNFKYSNCGSIVSLLDELKNYLQKQYKEKLFLVDCNG